MKKALPLLLAILAAIGCSSSEKRHYGGLIIDPPKEQPKIEMVILQLDEGLDSPPVLKTPIQAVGYYPASVSGFVQRGEIIVRFIVEADGKTSALSIDRASSPEFEKAVVANLQGCLFFPAKRGGRASACHVVCKIAVTAVAES